MKAYERVEATVVQSVCNADANHYIALRVMDAILREDIWGCVSRATIETAGTSQPVCCVPNVDSGLKKNVQTSNLWLKVRHLSDGHLWIPVIRSSFMQDWRCAGLPLFWQKGGQGAALSTVEAIMKCFIQGMHSAELHALEAFVQECRQAAEHRTLCETERERWFAEYRTKYGTAPGSAFFVWHSQLLHYDRLGAFLDHPFYPTARAKIGFDAAALKAYSPEFQNSFRLRWLAVPRGFFYSGTTNEKGLPQWWPKFEAVGLSRQLANTHTLIPIHPFLWQNNLDEFLENAHLRDIVRAPWSYLTVFPTLSVRTVALLKSPEWHIKLPLTIRTLGAKNIRTIKSSTIYDGHSVQTLLSDIASREPSIVDRLLLTREDCGGHVNQLAFLGYILRRYPVESIEGSTLIPVAALLAETPAGKTVVEEIAEQFYAGNLDSFWQDYLDVTLRLHLLLWIRYGIALESNQQNSVIVLNRGESRLRLLLKDNDAARIQLSYLDRRWPTLSSHVAGLKDRRIIVSDALSLAQMFTTITLHLNIAVLAEGIGPILGKSVDILYSTIRTQIKNILAELAQDGEEISFARQVLLENERQYIKYLLTAATLSEKSVTGADDVNKFYGMSAPNFLRMK